MDVPKTGYYVRRGFWAERLSEGKRGYVQPCLLGGRTARLFFVAGNLAGADGRAALREPCGMRDKREDGRKTEIFYKNTFPMCYAQDHLRDHAAHTLLTDGWKDIYSVGTGIDRQMIETLYAEEDLKTIGWTPYDCTPNFFALKSLPEPVTFDAIKESTSQPGLYSMSYDSCENWLDITLPDEQTKQFVMKTNRAVLSAHGKSLWVQGEDE